MSFIKLFTQINRSMSYIPKIKKCIDCNYYYVPKIKEKTSIYMESKCMKFLSADTDGRGPEFEYAYIVRSEKSMCGPHGKYFKEIPKKEN